MSRVKPRGPQRMPHCYWKDFIAANVGKTVRVVGAINARSVKNAAFNYGASATRKWVVPPPDERVFDITISASA